MVVDHADVEGSAGLAYVSDSIACTHDGMERGVVAILQESGSSWSGAASASAGKRYTLGRPSARSAASSSPTTSSGVLVGVVIQNHHLAGRQRRGRVARPTSFAPGPSSAGGFWDRASEASAEASCASVHAAQAFAPSLNPRPQASASARVALYSRSPSSLPSLVDRNQSSKPGRLVSGIPSTPKTPRRRRRRREARRASCRPGPAVTRREMVAVQEE